mmetsp:Transcript_78384/g.138942  ORF Transcript_78384/g.138942 Transcript_78384/m.138942 type:complete len:223 (+) Transcript_78384:79-747(+)
MSETTSKCTTPREEPPKPTPTYQLSTPRLVSEWKSQQSANASLRPASAPCQRVRFWMGETTVYRPRPASATSREVSITKARPSPGALDWLYSQPDMDDKRSRSWLHARPPTEQKLRYLLRKPLSQIVTGTEYKTRLEQRTKFTATMTKIVDRANTQMPNAPAISAGRLRIEKVQNLPLHLPVRRDPREKPASAEEQSSETTQPAASQLPGALAAEVEVRAQA